MKEKSEVRFQPGRLGRRLEASITAGGTTVKVEERLKERKKRKKMSFELHLGAWNADGRPAGASAEKSSELVAKRDQPESMGHHWRRVGESVKRRPVWWWSFHGSSNADDLQTSKAHFNLTSEDCIRLQS